MIRHRLAMVPYEENEQDLQRTILFGFDLGPIDIPSSLTDEEDILPNEDIGNFPIEAAPHDRQL